MPDRVLVGAACSQTIGSQWRLSRCPSPRGTKYSSIPLGHLIADSSRSCLSRAWCGLLLSTASTVIHGEGQGNVSLDFHTFMALGALAVVSSVAGTATAEPDLLVDHSNKCMKSWTSTLVHPAKVVLPISNLICFNILVFFFYQPCLWVIGEIETSIWCPMGLFFLAQSCILWLLKHDLWSFSSWWGYFYMVLSFFNFLICMVTGNPGLG